MRFPKESCYRQDANRRVIALHGGMAGIGDTQGPGTVPGCWQLQSYPPNHPSMMLAGIRPGLLADHDKKVFSACLPCSDPVVADGDTFQWPAASSRHGMALFMVRVRVAPWFGESRSVCRLAWMPRAPRMALQGKLHCRLPLQLVRPL